MPRNYGSGGGDGGDCDTFDGSGGASGRYGSQTPLDGLHRQNIFETDFRAEQQAEQTEDPAAGAVNPRAPFDCER